MNDENHQQTEPDVTHKMTTPSENQELSAAYEFDFSMKPKMNFGHKKKQKNHFVLFKEREIFSCC